jgi:YaiO family outer membrane protein
MAKQKYYQILFFTLLVLILPAFQVIIAQEGNLSSDEYFVLAKAEGKKQNFKKALEHCEKASELAPLDMDIREYLGKCYMENGQLEKARIVLQDVLIKSPRRVDARHYLLNIEIQTKRYSSAVCYANELLEITPYSKTLWMRKINLYNMMNNRMEANRETKRLFQIFPEDKEVRALYNNVLREDAVKMSKGGDVTGAVKQYEEALKVTKYDPQLYLDLMNAQIRMGNAQAALSTADRGLFYIPGNTAIVNKKIGILQEQGQYQLAIELVKEQMKRNPSPYYSSLLNYLTGEAARYFRNSDPYELYGQLYERDKGNSEAQEYLLNTAISRGYYADAQEMLSRSLKSSPTSKDLLSKQLLVYENTNNRQGASGTVERLYKLYPQDADVREKYDNITFQDAKAAFAEGDYQSALPVFIRLSQHPDLGEPSGSYIFSIYLAQKSYDRAMEQIDKLIRRHPSEQQYILKKIDLLAAMEEFEAAYEMAREYRDRYPDNLQYRYMMADLAVNYIKFLNGKEDYTTIKYLSDELIAAEPNNILGYNYGIGARISVGEYEEALELIDQALERFPDSKDLRLKQAGVYGQAGRHEEAVAALRKLREDFPYNSEIKGALIEEMFLMAKKQEQDDKSLQAIETYKEILAIRPKDTLAPIRLSNIYIKRQEYPEAMMVVDKALEMNPENPDLLYQKGLIFELTNDFKQAREYQAKYIPPAHKLEEHKDHLEYLDSKSLRNQVIMSYLDVRTDSIPVNTSVATLEYMRFNRNNTYTGRINYAGRQTGTGMQGEIDWYHTFKDKSNFLLNAGVANRYFTKYKIGISLFKPFKTYWQAELGLRYAKLPDDRTLITGVGGLERTFGSVWLNARLMVMSDSDDIYNTVLAQARFYMRNQRDYAIAMASVGNAPEDQKLDFLTYTFLSYTNTMVGAGYFHYTSYRTSIGIMGNWYNYRISPDFYLNQYNLFLTLRTRF